MSAAERRNADCIEAFFGCPSLIPIHVLSLCVTNFVTLVRCLCNAAQVMLRRNGFVYVTACHTLPGPDVTVASGIDPDQLPWRTKLPSFVAS